MKDQNYANHIRFYPPHHFVFYPLMLALTAGAIYFGIRAEDDTKVLWIFMVIALAVMVWLSFMLRQHYALTLQNRIVRIELRFRYFALTGERLELLEPRLSQGQLFALRFASDEEFPVLVKRALAENLSGDQIKKAIVHWQPDHSRV